jgi:hypothetical protein
VVPPVGGALGIYNRNLNQIRTIQEDEEEDKEDSRKQNDNAQVKVDKLDLSKVPSSNNGKPAGASDRGKSYLGDLSMNLFGKLFNNQASKEKSKVDNSEATPERQPGLGSDKNESVVPS